MELEKPGGRKKWLALISSYKYVLLVAAAGVALLLWPESPSASLGGSAQESAQTAGAEEALREMESAMEDILEKIQGVGQVDVMLTLQSGGEFGEVAGIDGDKAEGLVGEAGGG